MSNPRPKVFLSLDLEMAQPSGKIIQIGAVVGNIDTGEILDKVNCVVNCGEKLSDKIITLTGITQERHDKGMPLQYAYDILKDIHAKHEAFINPVTWGGNDSFELRNQLGLVDGNFIFGRRCIDTKTLFQSFCIANDLKVQSGLKKSCRRMDVPFEGPAHDALQDSINTFRLFRKMISLFKTEMTNTLFKND